MNNISAIKALLPQTHCKQCGYEGCTEYAEAIEHKKADINLCQAGGAYVAEKLAKHTNQPFKAPIAPAFYPSSAIVIEENCIGCTLCIQVCPTDAIIGAAKVLHTVVKAWCTGCKLCEPVCPTECITMRPLDEVPADWNHQEPSAQTISWLAERAELAQKRFETLNARKAKKKNGKESAMKASLITANSPPALSPTNSADAKKAAIQAAMERAKQMRAKNS